MADIEVTKDEADRRQFDAFELINKDPSKHYRLSRKSDMNVARHKFHGYEVVDTTTDPVRSVLTDGTRMKKGADTSTSIEIGDAILMSTSKENYARILREREDRIARQTRSVSQGFKRSAAKEGGAVQAYEEHRDNKAMTGMSEKAYDRMKEEERRERQREVEKLGLKS